MTTERTPISPDEEPQSSEELEPDESGTVYIDGGERSDGVISSDFTRPTGFQR